MSKEKLTFDECVLRVKNIVKQDLDDMDYTTKYNLITQIIRKYYLSEDIHNVFSSFLHLFIEFSNYLTALKNIRDDSLAIQTMQIFFDFQFECEPISKDIIEKSTLKDKISYVNFFILINFEKIVFS